VVAGCCPFDGLHSGPLLGIESGCSDAADQSALGRGTAGVSDQYTVGSQGRGVADYIGRPPCDVCCGEIEL
jgi:hypothetical protein